MSIARTLEGRLSATLVLLTAIVWLVSDVVECYPVYRPDLFTVILIVCLGVVAFKFYEVDKKTSRDPSIQKGQIDAAVEMFLDRLAKYNSERGAERGEF